MKRRYEVGRSCFLSCCITLHFGIFRARSVRFLAVQSLPRSGRGGVGFGGGGNQTQEKPPRLRVLGGLGSNFQAEVCVFMLLRNLDPDESLDKLTGEGLLENVSGHAHTFPCCPISLQTGLWLVGVRYGRGFSEQTTSDADISLSLGGWNSRSKAWSGEYPR